MIARDIEIGKVDEVRQQIVGGLASGNWSDLLAACHLVILEGVAENFAREENRFGEAWPARKDKKQHPLLRLTYAMYAAAATHGGAGQIERIGAQESTLGISLDVVPYARAQNFGDPEQNLPAREFYYVSDETEDRLELLVEKQVTEAIFGTAE